MSEWYFTKFGNDIPLPIASTEFTNAAMSGDGKTIAVGMLAYSQTSTNPDQGNLEVSVVAYRYNDQSQWAKLGDTMKLIYNRGAPNYPPLVTKEVFDNRDDLDLSLTLSEDGNLILAAIAVKGTNVTSSLQLWLYGSSGWVDRSGQGAASGKGFYGITQSPSSNVLAGSIDMTSRLGRVNYYTINLNLPQQYGALMGGPTIGANGLIGINGVTDSNVDDPNKSIWFGKSVKLSADGNTIAIGGYCTESGKGYPVYVYDIKDYEANSQQYNYNVDYKKGNFPLVNGPTNVLGERVLWLSPDGNTIAVGYPNSESNKGYVVVYVYSATSGAWSQKGYTMYGSQAGDMFGASLELNADATLMVVGSPGSNSNTGKVTVYQYSSSVASGWVLATSSTLDGSTSSGEFGMQLMANGAFSALGVVSNSATSLVSTYGTPDVTINFTTNDDPITLLRYQAIPSDNFISSVKYGVFLESTFPTSDVIVSGMPANTYDPGMYTVTYSVPNTNQIITNKSAAGAIMYTVTKQVQVSTTLNNAAPICFYAGSKVMTDQGEVEIQNIVPQKNSINGALVRDITTVINTESTMTLIMKNALSLGMPYRHTCVTNNHMILYDEKFVKAKALVDGLRDHNKATTVEYTGAPVYNVVMDEPSMMVVNGMTCETLHPRNIIYLRMKIRKEIVTCKDQERVKELLEQDRIIVEKANQYLAKK
jgi:hypothetical protein